MRSHSHPAIAARFARCVRRRVARRHHVGECGCRLARALRRQQHVAGGRADCRVPGNSCSKSIGEEIRLPIGAAIGGYVLLRLGELDRLQDWTKNLCKYFPWLPDGVVIYAEHLARVGEHQQALERFLELPKRGLPFTSSGLTAMVESLAPVRAYDRKGTAERDLKVVRGLVEPLGVFARLSTSRGRSSRSPATIRCGHRATP